MRRVPAPQISLDMEQSTTASDLSRAIVDEQPGQGSLWQAVSALQLYASSLVDSCFGKRVRVNTRELKLTRQIAEGGFSYVWAATDVRTGEAFAVKQVLCQTAEQRTAMRHEIDVHLGLSHPNVARLVDYAFQRISDDGTERASLVLPLWPRGSLQDAILPRLPRGPFFKEAGALRLFAGLVQGVQAFHSHEPPWSHRDICPRNVMVNEGGDAVLIDFGSTALARVPLPTRAEALALQDYSSIHSSPPYRAPELWDPPTGGFVTEKTDIWSLGATLFCLAFGYSPFESTRGADGRLHLCEPTHLRVLGRVEFPVGHSFSHAFCELILELLQADASLRPAAPEVLARVSAMLASLGSGHSR